MDKSIKVLQINKLYYPWIGGVEKVVQDIAEGLKDKVNMSVLVCQPKGKGNKEVLNGVKIYRADSIGMCFSMPISLNFPFQFKQLSRDMNILHFHMPFPLGEMSYLLMRPNKAVVAWWHSDIVRQMNILKIYKPFLMRFLRKVKKIIVATPRHIECSVFLKKFKDKCEVIPFGVDVNRFQLTDEIQEKVEMIRSRYGNKIILCVGRLNYYKGVEYLIRAMKGVNAKLLLIGDGPLKNSLQQLTADLGLESRIVFLGNVEDKQLPVYYHSCDIFVLPSIANSEAFGIVQLEAMSCGKPVINTNLPTGVPWVSIHGETGITVPPRDSLALANALNILLNSVDLREKYGQNARKRAEKEFTMELMLERVLSVYKQVADNKTK